MEKIVRIIMNSDWACAIGAGIAMIAGLIGNILLHD